jgi:signal transduction histidine kinase
MTAVPSIRRRLSRAMLIGSLIVGLVMCGAVWWVVQQEVDELLDDTLRASAEVLSSLLARGDALPVTGIAGSDERFAWQVVDASNRVLQRSAPAPERPFSATATAGFVDTPLWRVFGAPLGSDGRTLFVAQTRAERSEAEFEVAVSSVAAALGIGLLGYLWFRARLREELAPLLALSNRLASYEPLSPDATMGPADRAELEPVHRAVDQLAARLAQRLQRERAFSAHAAHALRTPLAGLDAQLSLALREQPDAIRHRLVRAREATARLQRVVSALLTLFRSDTEPRLQPVALDRLLMEIAPDRLRVDSAPGLTVEADPDLLAAALANLLDNAQRHGATTVTVSMPTASRLCLHDDGPGVTAERHAALVSALQRESIEGTIGLGLTLADLVARAHGGGLTLPDPIEGKGFSAELRLSAVS